MTITDNHNKKLKEIRKLRMRRRRERFAGSSPRARILLAAADAACWAPLSDSAPADAACRKSTPNRASGKAECGVKDWRLAALSRASTRSRPGPHAERATSGCAIERRRRRPAHLTPLLQLTAVAVAAILWSAGGRLKRDPPSHAFAPR
ncbi:MAG: hypothetical protein ACLP0J_29085 [Solirubrobacteraceae bacterium]|jgi:hypothetical protein